MKKKGRSPLADVVQAQLDTVLKVALLKRAEELAEESGHTLSSWTAAKRKLGRGAMRSTCLTCGRVVIAMPFGDGRFDTRAGQIASAPGLRGEALAEMCMFEMQG